MHEKEKLRATHLMILLCYTIFSIVLAGETLLLGWEKWSIAILLLGFVASWTLHFTEKIDTDIRLWLYFILTMMAFFFYGIHETSIYDLAPVMIFVIIMYSATEICNIINFCIATYYFTICYDFMFVIDISANWSPLFVTRTLLHLLLVYMAAYLAKYVIRRRNKEKELADEKITHLEEINRRTEDFMANVSHELRTPINAVTGITSVMLKNEEDASKKKDILSVQMAGHRLFSQIEDILDFTEIDTGRIKLSEDAYMISSIVNDIITGNRMFERDNDIELIFDIDASVPAMLLGDGRKIKKIMKHLIDNATKFTKKGGVYVRVYALPKSYGINLCIKVCDTGIGISSEDLGKIKERFFQSNAGRNRRTGGLGLGLSIVYGMVAAMEGFIQIESTEGEGTTVSVSIPQKVEDEAPCMVLENREELCLACYLKPEKYEVPEVRNYYDEMISHMVCGLDIVLHRVFKIEELERLIQAYKLTHLFIGEEEYEENEDYFENLDLKIEIIVVANDSLALPADSRTKVLHKPFYALPVINMLNAGTDGDAELFKEKQMICPGVSVLVVDDEPMNLMVSEGIFKDYQMEVKTVGSGMEAVRICETETFDVIFLDHMMPEMDGVETLKQLRRIQKGNDRETPVIAFTANAVSGAREMFMQEGFDGFVSKPIESMELERVLRRVLPGASVQYIDRLYAGKKSNGAGQGDTDKMQKNVSSKQEKLAYLEKAEINTRSGLNYCRSDMEFYEKLLLKFAQDAVKKKEGLDEALEKEDADNYRILVHALKSNAKMVGADKLSEMARKAEEAAKKHDINYLRRHHDRLMELYHDIAQNILQLLSPDENVSATDAEENCRELTKDEWKQRLLELKESLDLFEADKAERLIEEIIDGKYQGTSVKELLSDIIRDVDDFELGAAAEKVGAIFSSMEGGEA